ncbi:lipid A-modifier LpxR family protein [Sulfitobacter sp.]|uniref:lipid A-modifier LpxR family protein n=1 Tax=Sulfitobacter sp. TaxID=1903071 RepID=UPI003EF205A7
MFRHVAGSAIALVLSLLLVVEPADAGPREKLGYGRLVTNDYFGDGKDRWRTGSLTSSRVWGSEWTGQSPARFGDLIELRLSSEIIVPSNVSRPAAGDRPYAGALSIGAHTHFMWQGFDAALGADMVVTGSGTGLGSFQREVHKILGATVPSQSTLDDQIAGGLHPTIVGEMSRELAVTPNLHLRPFLEGRAGAETLVRAGFDLTFGQVGRGDLMVRESVTGQRYRVVRNEEVTGFTFLLGADIAHVSDSIYLPEDRGYELTESRDRLRAGVHWQGHGSSAFYGVTYLGEEFEAQTEGQLVGSLRVKFSF